MARQACHARTVIVIVIAALALAGCTSVAADPPPVPINFYPREGLRPGQITRVLVLPFANETSYGDEVRRLSEIVTAELSRANHFEVLPLDADALGGRLATGRHAPAPDADSLARLAHTYGADGVLLTTVTQLRPYGTPLVGLHFELRSSITGNQLWLSDGVIDGADDLTVANIKKYFRTRDDLASGTEDYESVRRSLNRFFAFAAHVFVERL